MTSAGPKKRQRQFCHSIKDSFGRTPLGLVLWEVFSPNVHRFSRSCDKKTLENVRKYFKGRIGEYRRNHNETVYRLMTYDSVNIFCLNYQVNEEELVLPDEKDWEITGVTNDRLLGVMRRTINLFIGDKFPKEMDYVLRQYLPPEGDMFDRHFGTHAEYTHRYYQRFFFFYTILIKAAINLRHHSCYLIWKGLVDDGRRPLDACYAFLTMIVLQGKRLGSWTFSGTSFEKFAEIYCEESAKWTLPQMKSYIRALYKNNTDTIIRDIVERDFRIGQLIVIPTHLTPLMDIREFLGKVFINCALWEVHDFLCYDVSDMITEYLVR
jgi:hypothetical protein